MKQHIFPAIKISFLLIIVFAILYPALIWAIAQATPNHGKGETISVNGKVVGYANEAQNFSADKYFSPRPSAVGYNAAGSGGSNKGPNNADYLQVVKDRLDRFLVHNPSVKKDNVPVELLTASGSGLDPDLSLEAVNIQVARVATARTISASKIKVLVQQHLQKPFLGMFGPRKINVLQLNIALDNLK